MTPALIMGIASGVAELVRLGIVAANQSKEAEAIMLKNMKPTPSTSEVDEYRAAQRGDATTTPVIDLDDQDVEDDDTA